MFPEIRGGRSMDRIAVRVIWYGHDKLPHVSDDTGGEAGPSCIDLIQEHHVPERMKGMSLDTSASNTGTCLPSILAHICLQSLPDKDISVFNWSYLRVRTYDLQNK